MRTNIFNVLTLLALSAVVSCQKKELNDEENNSGRMSDIILRAEIDNEEADKGKTHLEAAEGSNYSVVWDKLDNITIIDSKNNSAQYKVIGEGGTTSASFELVQGSGEIDDDSTPYKAYSPSTLMVDNQLVWPSEQSYVAVQGSTTCLQGVSNAPMFAENTEGLEEIFKFKNIGGLLRLTLKNGNDAKVTSIKVSTNNGEKLSGPFTVEYVQDDKGNSYPKAVIDPIKGKNSIVLNMPDGGVNLGNDDSGVHFYFAVAARTYHDLTFEVSTDKGVMRMTAKIASGIEATRSSIITLPKTVQPSDWKQEFEWIDLGLPSGKLWANKNIGAKTTADYGDYFFWGETEPWFSYDASDSYNITWINSHTYPKTDFSDLNMKNLKVDLTFDYKKYDAAFINTAGVGYMPCKVDWEELYNYTTYERKVTVEGKYYMKFTGSNGNSILLPYAGAYRKDKESSKISNSEEYAIYNTCTAHSTTGYQYYAGEMGGGGFQVHQSNYLRYNVAAPVRAIKNPDPVVPADVEYIDLGVVVDGKKLLWADRNIGASSPEDAGYYIAWGAAEIPYSSFNGSNFTFKTGRPRQYGTIDGNNWPADSRLGFGANCSPFHMYKSGWYYEKYNATDKKTELDLEDDLAVYEWGGGWRIPNITQMEALATQCIWIAKKDSKGSWLGFYVYKVKEESHKGLLLNGNGNKDQWNSIKHDFSEPYSGKFPDNYSPDTDICIFLPYAATATGLGLSSQVYSLYWTSTLVSDKTYDNAYGAYIMIDGATIGGEVSKKVRTIGGIVRPVFVVE